MKRLLSLTLCAGLALGALSCNKDDDNQPNNPNNPGGLASNTISISDTNYSVTSVYTATPTAGRINLVGLAQDNSTGWSRIVGVHFNGTALPTASKEYVIGTDMMPVTLNWTTTGGAFGSQDFGAAGEKVNVTVDGAKVTVKFTNLTQVNPSGGTRKLSAHYVKQ